MDNMKQARRAIEKAAENIRSGKVTAEQERASADYYTVIGEFDLEKLWCRIRHTTQSRAPQSRARRRAYIAAISGLAAAAIVLLAVILTQRGETLIYSSPEPAVELIATDGTRVSVARDVPQIVVGDGAIRNDTLTSTLYYESVGEPVEVASEVSYVTLSVPHGGSYSIVLPDGTQAWLNSNTTIRFPDRFGPGSRDIELDGEAFFDVAKDEARPLRIHAGDYSVTALGTSFNVQAWAGSGHITTVLASGVVEVGNGIMTATLAPGQQCVIDLGSGEMQTTEVDVQRMLSWREGKVYFVGWPMERVVEKMALWYDFEIVYADPEIASMRFSGTIDKQRPLNELLHFMEQTGTLGFDVEGQRVTVYKRK